MDDGVNDVDVDEGFISQRQLSNGGFGPVLLALLIGFVIGLLIILRRRHVKRRDFLLVGLCESGKSAICMQMLYKKLPDTFTSLTENLGDYRSGRMSGRLIDIPGHYRVRSKYFDQYKKGAKGIIFVVDSETVHKEKNDIADALYSILTDAATQTCSVLVLCNKQDLTTAKSAAVIKNILEKEMNIVRDTRSRKLESTATDDSSKSIYLGKSDKHFEFSHLQQNVQFFECSAKDNQLYNLTDWIDRML